MFTLSLKPKMVVCVCVCVCVCAHVGKIQFQVSVLILAVPFREYLELLLISLVFGLHRLFVCGLLKQFSHEFSFESLG